MKKLVLLIAVVLTTSMFANFGKPTPKAKKEIRTKIVKLLADTQFDFEVGFDATVDLLVNKKGEVIVLDVDSKNEKLKNYITSKLNYKKVYKTIQDEVTLYKMPLKVVVE